MNKYIYKSRVNGYSVLGIYLKFFCKATVGVCSLLLVISLKVLYTHGHTSAQTKSLGKSDKVRSGKY